MQAPHFDTVVIGSGVAGLSFLHYYAGAQFQHTNKKSVALFCKSSFANTNTNWAQGGIAAVAPQPTIHHDSTESHIQDTLIAGAHINNKEIVKKVVEKGPELMQDLISMGMPFDTNQNSQLDLAKEGGHAAHRVWHVKDYTGKATTEYPSGEIYEGYYVDGLREGSGVYAYPNGDKYEGEWLKNLKHGIGRMNIVAEGEFYGRYENGKKHGEGVFTYKKTKDIYSGSWRYGKKHGKGTYIFDATKMKVSK